MKTLKLSDSLPKISGYHAHVYFDKTTLEQARNLCEAAGRCFPISVGRIHQKPVGPHPDWSCQLAFKPELFGQLVPWLAFNRQGLVIFIHPDTGHDLDDHTERAIWMGEVKKLDLSKFK